MAIVHQPQILFLDEPTVGMDPLARANFWEVINELNQKDKTTIFLTTQYLDEAEKNAKKMAMIMDGNIQFSGTISEFKRFVTPDNQINLEDSYLQFVTSNSNTKK